MTSPVTETAAMYEPSRSRPTVEPDARLPSLSAIGRGHPIGSQDGLVEVFKIPCAEPARLQESVPVCLDQVRAHQKGDYPSSSQKRTERDTHLASAGAVARHEADADR